MKKTGFQLKDLDGSPSPFRTAEALALGIPRVTLSRLVKKGELTRLARGIYVKADRDPTELDALVEVAARCTQGIFCLLTALRFHHLTTQSPFETWLAIPAKARKPNIEYPPVRIVWYSGLALSESVETHLVEGHSIKVYGVAKTIADCFKYRNKIGLDVALEALQDAWKQGRVTMSDLYKYGKICRVENIMRPYLESLV